MENTPSSSSLESHRLGSVLGLTALVLLLAWQLFLSIEARNALSLSAKQLEAAVGQSQQVQGNVKKLLDDLLALSEKNTNARSVVQKYGVKRNAALGKQEP